MKPYVSNELFVRICCESAAHYSHNGSGLNRISPAPTGLLREQSATYCGSPGLSVFTLHGIGLGINYTTETTRHYLTRTLDWALYTSHCFTWCKQSPTKESDYENQHATERHVGYVLDCYVLKPSLYHQLSHTNLITNVLHDHLSRHAYAELYKT